MMGKFDFVSGGHHVLATHILQFMFLGHTGFKWPVAYYATTEAHATELTEIVWDVIKAVKNYCFRVRQHTYLLATYKAKNCRVHHQNFALYTAKLYLL